MKYIRAALAVLAVSGALLMCSVRDLSGVMMTPPSKVYITPVARRILRSGYDTATAEKIFCARTRFTAAGTPYVDTAFAMKTRRATPTGVETALGSKCPADWGTAHWHLGTVPNSYPWSPSFTDMTFAACNRAPFHVIVAPEGEYYAYGFAADIPKDVCS